MATRVPKPLNQEKSLVSLCKQVGRKMGLVPVTKKNLIYFYTPLTGALSYAAMSVNVMNPGLVIRMFPKRDLTNLLLVHTLLGTGVYIYSRPHMNKSSSRDRLSYSVFGALMFTFGSVLSWAVLRSILPENVLICTTVGIGTSAYMLKTGKQYMDYVDKQAITSK